MFFDILETWGGGRSGDCAGLKIRRSGFDTHPPHDDKQEIVIINYIGLL